MEGHSVEAIVELIRTLRKEVDAFITCIEQNDIADKEEKANNVYDTLVHLKTEAELQIKALDDKPQLSPDEGNMKKVLISINGHIGTLIDILDENPNLTDYKEGLLKTVIDDINEVIRSMNALVLEHEQLKKYFS
ncbi:MAG: hypothetical protein V1725_02990 [archaeon]